jgi:hypothetical protein
MPAPSPSSLVAVLVGIALAACNATQGPLPADAPPEAPAAEAPDDDTRLPPALEDLHLDAAQKKEIVAIRRELRQRFAALEELGFKLAHAIADAVRRCDPDDHWMRLEAQRAVAAVEELRPTILDAITRVHRLLTPAQRQALSDRLLADDDERESKRDDDRGVRALGETIDLSFGQILEVLERSRPVRGEILARISPMRDDLHAALEAFPGADFDIRTQAIAQADIAQLASDFVFAAAHVVLPVLEPAQCKALGDFIDERFTAEEKKRAAKKTRDEKRSQ